MKPSKNPFVLSLISGLCLVAGTALVQDPTSTAPAKTNPFAPAPQGLIITPNSDPAPKNTGDGPTVKEASKLPQPNRNDITTPQRTQQNPEGPTQK